MTGTLNMNDLIIQLSQYSEGQLAIFAGMSFMLIGLMVKSAVFPLHLWLPPAYSYAPSAVSTLFAALATKAILIFFVRILYEVFSIYNGYLEIFLDYILLPLSLIAIFVGTIIAIYQNDIKNNFTEFPKDFNKYDLVQSLDTESKAWQIRGGLKFILSKWFRMGFSLSLPYTISVIERHGTNEVLTFDNGDTSDAIDAGYYNYKVKAPMIMDFGGAFTFEAFTLSSSFRTIDWSSMRFDLSNIEVNSEDYKYLRNENDIFKFQYDYFAIQIRLGIETLIQLNENFGITFRGGYASIPSPSKNAYVKDYYSIGAGIPIDSNVMLDLAWILNNQKKQSSDIYTPVSYTHLTLPTNREV